MLLDAGNYLDLVALVVKEEAYQLIEPISKGKNELNGLSKPLERQHLNFRHCRASRNLRISLMIDPMKMQMLANSESYKERERRNTESRYHRRKEKKLELSKCVKKGITTSCPKLSSP